MIKQYVHTAVIARLDFQEEPCTEAGDGWRRWRCKRCCIGLQQQQQRLVLS